MFSDRQLSNKLLFLYFIYFYPGKKILSSSSVKLANNMWRNRFLIVYWVFKRVMEAGLYPNDDDSLALARTLKTTKVKQRFRDEFAIDGMVCLLA